MRTVRQPAVAGRFYPGRPADLESMLAGLFAATEPGNPALRPKALIVPHAGYIYSGPTAAIGYRHLEPLAGSVTRVVVIGPAHYLGFTGVALATVDAFATPLGEVRIDHSLDADLLRLGQVIVADAAHAPEHSVEVQLPFLQRVLPQAAVVPILVGEASGEDVADVIEACWGGPQTVIVISSDLSHYLPYAEADTTDADTVNRILRLHGPLPDRRACGARGINGLLIAAQAHDLRPVLLDRRNSGDTAGDRERVVGYAAISFGGGHHGQS